ncbi:MAG: hypothetical protein HY461_01385 [Parcubacteria group bacterium]|nr:hypothetical protein [Parcubacteria group bacterium]
MVKLKSLPSLAVLAITAWVVPSAVFASAIGDALGRAKNLAGKSGLESDQSPETIVGSVINVIIGILGIVAVGLIIYAGSLWITAAGNEEKVTQAKTLIKQVVVGIIIVGMAYAITAFIVNIVLG